MSERIQEPSEVLCAKKQPIYKGFLFQPQDLMKISTYCGRNCKVGCQRLKGKNVWNEATAKQN